MLSIFHSTSTQTSTPQRGSVTVAALCFVVVIAGLSFSMLEMGLASRRTHARCDGNLYALEAAETGTARAEQEVVSNTDPDGDGVGTLFGSHGRGRFAVTATPDPLDPTRFKLVAQGWYGQATRRIETLAQVKPGGPWEYGLFAKEGITFGSNNAATDAYDSRLGSWESQAVNFDGNGYYAQKEGNIGSNGPIRMGSQSLIRGDAHPGPGYSVDSPENVTGETTPLEEELALPPTPYTEFLAAANTNSNGDWKVEGKVNYDPATMSLSVSSGTTITLTGQTYFFSNLSLSGGAILKIENGPVKVYITDEAALSGGTIFNVTAQPINLQFYQQPYALPKGYTPKTNKASISGGTNSAFVMYAPSTDITMSGNGAVNGAIIAREFWMKGGGQVHFDLALKDQLPAGPPKLRRLLWRDVNPPRR